MFTDKTSSSGRFLLLASCALVLLLTGCARYQAQPLPTESMLEEKPQSLRCAMEKQQSAGLLGQHEVNPADGLDLTEVAILAVLNNPDLKAKRTRQQIAGAQLFAAGLLPDPRLNASLDIPTGNTTGTVNAWGLGLDYDIIPLITRQAGIDAEQHDRIQVDLELLWQEWQVMQQARSLAVCLVIEQKKMKLLRSIQGLYIQRYDDSTKALDRGDITLETNGTDLTALLDIFSQTSQLEQAYNETRHKLNLLLGLAPEVELPCLIPQAPTLPDLQTAEEKIKTMQDRRPDLLALKAGYLSQEARVRGAIMSQFPSLSIGITRARDTGNLYTTGFGISLNLPLFSGNRGAIAIERADREQLKEEYRARLSQAVIDVDKLINLQRIISRQLGRLKKYLPHLREIVDKGRQAYKNGDIDALTFINMEYTWVIKRLEELDLEKVQWGNFLALQTLLALPGDNGFPPVAGTEKH